MTSRSLCRLPGSIRRLRSTCFAAAAACVLAFTGSAAVAHSPSGHAHHGSGEQSAQGAARDAVVRLPEIVLLDQYGRPIWLASELVGERIVVADFIYTTCTTVCPVASAMMSEVQRLLGDRVGRDVHLVSFTVDPKRDTPARLLAYSRKHDAGPGWFWITGSPDRIARALKGFGTWTPNFEDHPAVTMVGDGRSGRWTRFYGFTDPQTIVAAVNDLFAARAGASILRPVARKE